MNLNIAQDDGTKRGTDERDKASSSGISLSLSLSVFVRARARVCVCVFVCVGVRVCGCAGVRVCVCLCLCLCLSCRSWPTKTGHHRGAKVPVCSLMDPRRDSLGSPVTRKVRPLCQDQPCLAPDPSVSSTEHRAWTYPEVQTDMVGGCG